MAEHEHSPADSQVDTHTAEPDCEETIHKGGFRFTKQRREVYDALVGRRDHPTAVDIFMRVKERVPNISLATVYNCLETLATVGLVKQVNLERAPSRYCSNLHDHGHFFCEECGSVTDVDVTDTGKLSDAWKLPADCVVTHQEFNFRGLCPQCTAAHAGGGSRAITPRTPAPHSN